LTNAREQLAMRNRLQNWLKPEEIRDIHWPPLLNASADAIARGWTGDELARWIIGDLAGNPPENIGAVAMATIRQLASQDPDRDTTPTPERYDDTERRARIANAATPEQATHWANHIRQTIANTQTHGHKRG
jgi:hypothetical protein